MLRTDRRHISNKLLHWSPFVIGTRSMLLLSHVIVCCPNTFKCLLTLKTKEVVGLEAFLQVLQINFIDKIISPRLTVCKVRHLYKKIAHNIKHSCKMFYQLKQLTNTVIGYLLSTTSMKTIFFINGMYVAVAQQSKSW